ncbi:MAG TPA: phosphatidylserine decarboxylase [Candidatus Aminicenantes bacterium]|nr:phosphatidylserine decarboxylase [Candidatus Aminicenantes bacterium]
MRVAREGLPFILGAVVLAVLWGLLGLGALAVLFFLFAGAFAFFFRDPERVPPPGEGLVVSPADGEVLGVDDAPGPPDLEGPAKRITVFLSLLDVHFVRAPLAGTVARSDYQAGKFLPAYRPEAGRRNESRTLVFKAGPADLVLKMIVGVAARRIKAFVKAGDAVERGEKVGLMYFGSRVELTLPARVAVKVGLRDKVKAGRTVIGEVRP